MTPLGPGDGIPLWPFIVCAGGGPAGLGSWVAPTLVLTCGHLMAPQRDPERSEDALYIAPLFSSQGAVRVELIGMEPSLDLALLATERSLPAAHLPDLRYPERLGLAQDRLLWKAWGIPQSAVGQLGDGEDLDAALTKVRRAVRSCHGSVADQVGAHRYQLSSDGELLFESGFSGSAVRSASGAVVGVLTSRDDRSHRPTSKIGFLVSIDGAAEAFPQLREYVGWRFQTDTRLRAAWRWEDGDLSRPTLGSYFTGRESALRELLSIIEKAS